MGRDGAGGTRDLPARRRGQIGVGWAGRLVLAIANALRSLPAERTRDISVLTFGCAIAEELKDCRYAQFLGLLDGLGVLNSWGHKPEQWPLARHGTNSFIPLSLPVTALVGSTSKVG
jgi:hypothetical protein